MPESEDTSMIVEEFKWSWHPTASVEIKFHNYRSKQPYNKGLKPGSFLYMSFTAALVTYLKKPEEKLTKEELNALETIKDLMESTCMKSKYKSMYSGILDTLSFWQEMDEF